MSSPVNRTALREEGEPACPPSQQVSASPVRGPTPSAARPAPSRRSGAGRHPAAGGAAGPARSVAASMSRAVATCRSRPPTGARPRRPAAPPGPARCATRPRPAVGRPGGRGSRGSAAPRRYAHGAGRGRPPSSAADRDRRRLAAIKRIQRNVEHTPPTPCGLNTCTGPRPARMPLVSANTSCLVVVDHRPRVVQDHPRQPPRSCRPRGGLKMTACSSSGMRQRMPVVTAADQDRVVRGRAKHALGQAHRRTGTAGLARGQPTGPTATTTRPPWRGHASGCSRSRNRMRR